MALKPGGAFTSIQRGRNNECLNCCNITELRATNGTLD
jgi:hypothetical protein